MDLTKIELNLHTPIVELMSRANSKERSTSVTTYFSSVGKRVGLGVGITLLSITNSIVQIVEGIFKTLANLVVGTRDLAIGIAQRNASKMTVSLKSFGTASEFVFDIIPRKVAFIALYLFEIPHACLIRPLIDAVPMPLTDAVPAPQ